MSKDSFAEYVLEQLDGLPLAKRPMFGALGIFAGGKMCAIVSSGRLYLKANGTNRKIFSELRLKPFTYAPGKTLKSYFEAPVEALDDPETLRRWFIEFYLNENKQSE